MTTHNSWRFDGACDCPRPGGFAWDKTTVDASGCWLWTGSLSSNGYGRAGQRYAHRLAYETVRGPIPDGLVIDHLCRTRNCVNPCHMEPVTSAENTRRGLGGAVHGDKTHCPAGHAYTPENTYAWMRPARGGRKPTTVRYCRACHLVNSQNSRAGKKAS